MPERSKTARSPRCPICRGRLPLVDDGPDRGPRFAPMCSLRCKRIDLATWLGEGYRIAGASAESERDDEARAPESGGE